MDLLGFSLTSEHARIIAAFLGVAFAAAGFIAGRWGRHISHVRFKREDLVSSSVVVELYAIRHETGRDVLHIVTQGNSHSIDSYFRSPDLVRRVQRAASTHPGLLHLKDPVAHRMMMDEGKDSLTGLDPRANMDYIHGREVREDKTLFAFAAYPEKEHDGNGLRDQVARLVLMVVSPSLIDRLADPAYIENLDVAYSGYRPRCGRLHDFAREWQRLQWLPHEQRGAGTDKVWQATVRTSHS